MSDQEDSDSEYILPENIGFFDFVEVEKTLDSHDEQNGCDGQNGSDAAEGDDMEFAFPLFSTNPTSEPGDVTANSEKDDLRNQLIVSLRDASEDVDKMVLKHNKEQLSKILGKTSYTASDITKFRSLAVDFDSIFTHNGKYNDKKSNSVVEMVLYEESNKEPRKTRKPGQRQRQAKKLGLQRELERKAKETEMKKLIKKKFHKRGGKRNSSKSKQVNKVIKFRAE